MLDSIDVKQLRVEEVVSLYQQFQEPDARFVRLVLWEKTNFATFGHTVRAVAEKLEFLSLKAQEDEILFWEDDVTDHEPEKFHKFVSILMKDSSGYEALYFVNRSGVTVGTLLDVLSNLEKLHAEACGLVGQGCLHISEVLAVAGPLMDEANPSLASMFPLIELKRNSPNVYMRDTTSTYVVVTSHCCCITYIFGVCYLFCFLCRGAGRSLQQV